jgi:c(7)-type cytochrome triheme protein
VTRLRERLARIPFWTAIATALIVLGAVGVFERLRYGLGATTNLTDRFPWGFWIGFDFLGIGMAAAGFTIVATVHLLHIERFEPIVRPALLTAFIGYALVVMVLVVDLGRWDRFWHPLVMWNPHSVMFEITWCVILYTTVLLIEFSPIVFERLGIRAPIRALHAISLPVMIAGVILSTLHQSSFGSLYLAVPGRLSPLWYSPILPVLFFISCLAAGLSMVVFESHLLARSRGFHLPMDVLEDLGKVIFVILAIFGTVRIQDLLVRHALGRAFHVGYQSSLFWIEFLLGVAVPAAMLLVPKVRKSRRGLFVASSLVLLGFAANRMNTVVTGLESWPTQTYVPAPQEFFIGLGIGALGFVAFAVAARVLPILPSSATPGRLAAPPLGRGLGAVATGALVVALGLTAMAVHSQRGRALHADSIPEATGALVSPSARAAFRMPPDVAMPQSADSPGAVVFPHAAHVDADAPECVACHGRGTPILARSGPTPHADWHDASHCGACHDGKEATDIQEDCGKCHAGQ